MGYATTNPPQLKVTAPANATQLWTYISTDIHTDVDASNYFTNGHALGMRVNDIIFVGKSDATKGVTVHLVTDVTVGGAATIAPAILA